MKFALNDLPNSKRAEIKRIAEIIMDVINPEMIILFGSYAKGTYVEHRYTDKNGDKYEYISDYDFLVVTKNNPEKAYVQENLIMNKAGNINPPINLEIHDIDYINKGLELGEYFWVDIVKEGIKLFDKGTVNLAQPRDLSVAEQRDKAQRYFNTWFPQVSGFISTSKYSVSISNLKIAAFLLHQATESLFYAILLVFTDYKPKTHNLWKLRRKSKPFSEDLYCIFRTETNKTDEHLFELLKRGYIDARYRADYIITEGELTILNERVNLMMVIVQKLCQDKITSFDV